MHLKYYILYVLFHNIIVFTFLYIQRSHVNGIYNFAPKKSDCFVHLKKRASHCSGRRLTLKPIESLHASLPGGSL